MKTTVMTCLAALAALSVTGCPVYPADDLCRSDWDCAPDYACDRGTGTCFAVTPPGCSRPSDCRGQSEVCAHNGFCMIGSCHLSDVGCVAGYSCVGTSPDNAWTCVPSGEVGVGGAPSAQDAGAGGTGTTGGQPTTEPPADAG